MNTLALPDTLAREGLVFASILGVLLLSCVLVLVLRTRSLPVCRTCRFRSVRRSHSHRRALDTLARTFFLYPHRCERCLRRFYCFRSRRVPRHSRSRSAASGRS
jgi:hypothetical protein